MRSKVQTQSPEFGTTKEDRVHKPAARQLKCPGGRLRTIEMVCWYEILRIDQAKPGERNLKGHPPQISPVYVQDLSYFLITDKMPEKNNFRVI